MQMNVTVEPAGTGFRALASYKTYYCGIGTGPDATSASLAAVAACEAAARLELYKDHLKAGRDADSECRRQEMEVYLKYLQAPEESEHSS